MIGLLVCCRAQQQQQSCTVDGVTYEDGSSLPSLDACQQCRCDSGLTFCVRVSFCRDLGQCGVIVTLPGACCPVCFGKSPVYFLSVLIFSLSFCWLFCFYFAPTTSNNNVARTVIKAVVVVHHLFRLHPFQLCRPLVFFCFTQTAKHQKHGPMYNNRQPLFN